MRSVGIKAIPRNAFFGLTELNYLNIERNVITNISPNAFAGITNLIQLSLYRNALTSLPETVFHGLPNLRELDISYNKLQSLNSSLFNGLNELLELHIGNNDITFLPSEIFHNCHKLTVLDLSHNKLQSLSSSLFNELNELLELHLDNNDIAFLPSEIFHDCPKLTVLDLSHNKLQSLSSSLFNRLNELLELHLGNNKITFLPSEMFHNFPKLKLLDLSHNNLQSLNSFLFNRLNELLELHFDYNDINSIPLTLFHSLTRLTHLNIGYNKLTSLSTTHFTALTHLRRLYLNGNELTALPYDIFHSLTELLKLYLQSNKLHFLAIHNLPKLSILYLSENRFTDISVTQDITEIGLNIFGLPRLHKLDLMYMDFNNLTHLSELPSDLWYMSIRNNKFSHLPDSIMILSNIRFLFIDNNELHHLPSFQNLTQLEILRLSGNPLSCDCHMEEFMKWSKSINIHIYGNCQYPIKYTGTSITDLTVSDLQCFKPNFTNTFESVYVGVNDSVTLRVNVNVAPPPHIQWITPKGIRIDSDSESNSRYRLEPDGSLFISSTQNEQAGMFVCIAENWKGVATAVRFLEIRTPPQTTTPFAKTFSISPYTEMTRTHMEYNETISTKIYLPETTNNIRSNNVLNTGYIVSFIIGLVVGISTIVLILCIFRQFCCKRSEPLKTPKENIDLSSVTRTEDESHLQYTDVNIEECNTCQQLTTTNNMTGQYANANICQVSDLMSPIWQ
uniref:Insulin-like growth factor-binding protein complex acid labile subunit-like n=1 Tax=Saccoglossus kowalevskii TaxID=10224 RepID=A0ABM0M5Y4_SACKO|nr:PREDICTED: insulin-like growth factor-binding protein complex acid labile subunit-like [Saccoglossus kowalevskii]